MTYEVVGEVGGFKRATLTIREPVPHAECGIVSGELISVRLAQFNTEILMSKKKSWEIFGFN
jgi:hypothetical protein